MLHDVCPSLSLTTSAWWKRAVWDNSTTRAGPQRCPPLKSYYLPHNSENVPIRDAVWPKQFFTTGIQREAQSEVKANWPGFIKNLFQFKMSAALKTKTDTLDRMNKAVVLLSFNHAEGFYRFVSWHSSRSLSPKPATAVDKSTRTQSEA